MSRQRSRYSKSGFTLIEMLVVIMVIVLLASLLAPALQKALLIARSTTCLNNIRQVFIAEVSYENDYHAYALDAAAGGVKDCNTHLFVRYQMYAYLGLPENAFPNRNTPAGRENSVLFCPSGDITYRSNGNFAYGSTSYLRNGRQFSTTNNMNTGESISSLRAGQVKSPSKYLFHFEAKNPWTANPMGFPASYSDQAYSYHSDDPQLTVSTVFWDGHTTSGDIFFVRSNSSQSEKYGESATYLHDIRTWR